MLTNINNANIRNLLHTASVKRNKYNIKDNFQGTIGTMLLYIISYVNKPGTFYQGIKTLPFLHMSQSEVKILFFL
jgi:hypothetical protein